MNVALLSSLCLQSSVHIFKFQLGLLFTAMVREVQDIHVAQASFPHDKQLLFHSSAEGLQRGFSKATLLGLSNIWYYPCLFLYSHLLFSEDTLTHQKKSCWSFFFALCGQPVMQALALLLTGLFHVCRRLLLQGVLRYQLEETVIDFSLTALS